MVEPAGEVGFAVSVEALAGQLSAVDRLVAIETDRVNVPMFPHSLLRPGCPVPVVPSWLAMFISCQCGYCLLHLLPPRLESWHSESEGKDGRGLSNGARARIVRSDHDFSACFGGASLLFIMSQAT